MRSPSGSRLLTRLGESSEDRRELSRPRLPRQPGRTWRRGLLAGCLAVVVSGASGCTILTNAYRQLHQHEMLDEFMVGHRNRVMAARAWHRQKHCFEGHHHLDEMKAGFTAGYTAVAEGGDGCVPAICPPEYWGWRYQSAQGQRAVNAWFAGYPHGAKAAEQAGIGHWSQIRPAGMASPVVGGMPASEGEVEMVPTPFMEEDNTLPAPPDPAAASGSVLDGPAEPDSESDVELPAGSLPGDEASHRGGLPNGFAPARGSDGLLESDEAASVSANLSDEPAGAGAEIPFTFD